MKKLKYFLIIVLSLLVGIIVYNKPKTNIVHIIQYKDELTNEKIVEAISAMAEAYYNHKDFIRYDEGVITSSETKLPYNPISYGKIPEYANADNYLYFNEIGFIYNLFNMTFKDASNKAYKMGNKDIKDITFDGFVSGLTCASLQPDINYCLNHITGVFKEKAAEEKTSITEQFNNIFAAGDIIIYKESSKNTYSAVLILDKAADGLVIGINSNGIYKDTYKKIKDTLMSETSTVSYDYYILNPLAELKTNYSITSDATNRIKYKNLVINKTISPKETHNVLLNDTITYKIVLNNKSTSKIEGIKITDTIPTGTTFVSATDGDSKLNWNLSLDANKEKEIIIKVKVKNDKTLIGKELAFNNTTVGDIKINGYSLKVNKSLPAESTKKTINDLVSKNINSNIIHTIYNSLDSKNVTYKDKTVESIISDYFQKEELTEGIHSSNCIVANSEYYVTSCITDPDKSKYTLKSTFASGFTPVIIKELTGGYNTIIPSDNRIYRPQLANFQAGDVLIVSGMLSPVAYVATGDNSFVYEKDGKVAKLSANEVKYMIDSLPYYKLYFTLRPTQLGTPVAVSSSFVSKPNQLKYTKDDKSINLVGGVVKLTYDTGYTENVELSKYKDVEISGYSTEELGKKDIYLTIGKTKLLLPIEIVGSGSGELEPPTEDDPPQHEITLPGEEGKEGGTGEGKDGSGTGEVHIDYESTDNPDTGITSILFLLLVLILGYFGFRTLVKKKRITFKI